MNNRQIKTLTQLSSILDNVLSIAANNLVMEATAAINPTEVTPELENMMKAINVELRQVKDQTLIYFEDFLLTK